MDNGKREEKKEQRGQHDKEDEGETEGQENRKIQGTPRRKKIKEKDLEEIQKCKEKVSEVGRKKGATGEKKTGKTFSIKKKRRTEMEKKKVQPSTRMMCRPRIWLGVVAFYLQI